MRVKDRNKRLRESVREGEKKRGVMGKLPTSPDKCPPSHRMS